MRCLLFRGRCLLFTSGTSISKISLLVFVVLHFIPHQGAAETVKDNFNIIVSFSTIAYSLSQKDSRITLSGCVVLKQLATAAKNQTRGSSPELD